jgi:hypothetical protein
LKTSQTLKGHSVSEATRAKLRAAATKQYIEWSPEQREEHRRKSSRPHTPEEIAKQIAAQTGHIVSEETRRKISQANKGQIPTEAARQRIANWNRSPEARAKSAERAKTLVHYRWHKEQ